MGDVMRFEIHRFAVCGDCGREWDCERCEAMARQHTRETGHITTLHVTHDIALREEKRDD